MAATKFHAKAPKTGIEGEFTYDFGDNLQDAISKFGEDVVFNLFKRQAIVDAQGVVRRVMEKGGSPEEAQARLDEWKPGVVKIRTGQSRMQKALKLFSSLSEEQKLEILKALKENA